MGVEQIKPELTKYLKKLAEQISIDTALVFGSYAQSKATENSDVDLLIISNDFKAMDEDKRIELLYGTSVAFPYDLHVYGFTLDEYNSASPLTSLGAVRNGKTIKIL